MATCAKVEHKTVQSTDAKDLSDDDLYSMALLRSGEHHQGAMLSELASANHRHKNTRCFYRTGFLNIYLGSYRRFADFRTAAELDPHSPSNGYPVVDGT